MYTKARNNVISRLCSGYAWDTTLKFIETNISNYPVIGIGSNYYGNYSDNEFDYIDINGIPQKKEIGKSVLIPTGMTPSVNNIYDMAGNVFEWTSEKCSGSNETCTRRGGGCGANYKISPAAVRFNNQFTDMRDDFGFRITLFL